MLSLLTIVTGLNMLSTIEPADCATKHQLHIAVKDAIMKTCTHDYVNCDGELEITLINCGEDSVELMQLEVKKGPATPGKFQGKTTFNFNPEESVIPAGRQRVFRNSAIYRDGKYTIKANYLIVNRKLMLQLPPIHIREIFPLRDAAMAKCRACKGDWGGHGIMGIVGCNCRTKDAGRTCRDGVECEGVCLLDHAEQVTEPPTAPPTTPSVEPKVIHGRPVGKCSEFQEKYGCYTIIPEGESLKPPKILPLGGSFICVD